VPYMNDWVHFCVAYSRLANSLVESLSYGGNSGQIPDMGRNLCSFVTQWDVPGEAQALYIKGYLIGMVSALWNGMIIWKNNDKASGKHDVQKCQCQSCNLRRYKAKKYTPKKYR
jgi:hypothetical protein